MRLLDLCNATDLTVSNTFSDKNQNKLITFSSADNNSEIDHILVKRSFLKYDSDIKVISHEERVTQQKLLVADITVDDITLCQTSHCSIKKKGMETQGSDCL